MTLFQVKRIEREAKRTGREHPRASVIVSTSQVPSGSGFACELSFCSSPTLEGMERWIWFLSAMGLHGFFCNDDTHVIIFVR